MGASLERWLYFPVFAHLYSKHWWLITKCAEGRAKICKFSFFNVLPLKNVMTSILFLFTITLLTDNIKISRLTYFVSFIFLIKFQFRDSSQRSIYLWRHVISESRMFFETTNQERLGIISRVCQVFFLTFCKQQQLILKLKRVSN